MDQFVIGFHDIDKSKTGIAGGKGANLGELRRIKGIHTPDGFCISTKAFKRIASESSIGGMLDRLSWLNVEDRDEIGALSRSIRRKVEETAIPDDIRDEIARHLLRLGEKEAFAIRSSATAEDLPSASFAGLQYTYLNITGKESILKHIQMCWASLFSERAIVYRIQHGFDHRKGLMAVVVQRMIFPKTAGILFTADPVSSNRKTLHIEAGFGLGEAMVSGIANPDIYKAVNGEIIEKKISDQKMAFCPVKEGGTKAQEIEPGRRNMQKLPDDQVVELERIGRKIEAHFGAPQDIEWCWDGDTFYMVQSRPITTLFPIPESPDNEYHIYISVGHQQMMTDPIKPLGISIWRLTAGRPMYQAGGRLFVDVIQQLASPGAREILLNAMERHDPLTKEALVVLINRGGLTVSHLEDVNRQSSDQKDASTMNFQYDPAIVKNLIDESQKSLEELRGDIQTKSGTELFDFIREDIQRLRTRLSDPIRMAIITAVINASFWINEKMQEWTGEKNVADVLSQSAPNNITAEMGLSLLDIADTIRPYPELLDFIQNTKGDRFLDELVQFEGGQATREAILSFLGKYGMRCPGEIDITRARWSERPSALIPFILSDVKNCEPQAGKQKFEQGRSAAMKKEQETLEKIKRLRDGEQKAIEAKRMIDLLRNFIGYREYPKYEMTNRYFVYRQALLKEAGQLARAGVIHQIEDIYFLSFDEFREATRAGKVDYNTIIKRKDDYRLYENLSPPRVIASDGEIVTVDYKRDTIPDNAIAGLPVSSGVVEGRARVILRMEDADLDEGDILVTKFTDPSWTPLFVSIKGIVAEVGGLMSHGAVIAREYGLPAVVGIDNAVKRIKDGSQIRVNGTEGYIEFI